MAGKIFPCHNFENPWFSCSVVDIERDTVGRNDQARLHGVTVRQQKGKLIK